MDQSRISHLTHKEPCPRCRIEGRDRKGDNLAVYSDGHKYCFSCKYLEKSEVAFDPRPKPETPRLKIVRRLPSDVTSVLPSSAANWLAGYEITKQEAESNFLMWAPNMSVLIFPFYGEDSDDLLAWQGRYFGPLADKPKYYNVGNRDTVFAYQNINTAAKNGIVIVEDNVSAIKVGRYAGTLPLLGSNLPAIKRVNLKHVSNKLVFWLDYNKRAEAYEMAGVCQALGYETKVIVTKEDPKELDDIEIQERLEDIGYGT